MYTDVVRSLHERPEPTARTAALRSNTAPDVEVMEAPSINSRMPPDGHEFPDYQEAPLITKQALPHPSAVPHHTIVPKQNNCVRSIIAKFSNSADEYVPEGEPAEFSNRKGLSKSVMNINTIESSLPSYNSTSNSMSHKRNHSNSTLELSINAQTLPKKQPELANNLGHMRSQSLIDISDKSDRWKILADQQRKRYSKLKGLIIPEHSDDENVAVVDLPEIKSNTTHKLSFSEYKPTIGILPTPNHNRNSSTPSLSTPIWNTETLVEVPKYSPAFKRKSLQVLSSKAEIIIEKPKERPQSKVITSQVEDDCRLPVTISINEAPKSLESITSPTRSDYSFEYISSSPELKQPKITNETTKPIKTDIGRSEDESDNDSAVSSSQSSYISRNSPPASPNHLQGHFHTSRENERDPLKNKYESECADSLNRCVLKPRSVEAINRKNILASAKCSSGRDFKVGSPLIERKFEEDQPPTETPTAEVITPIIAEETIIKDKTEIIKPAPIVLETTEVTLRTKESTYKRAPPISTRVVPRCLEKNKKSASVTDLRKNFEMKSTSVPAPAPTPAKTNYRAASLTPKTVLPPVAAKRNSLPVLPMNPTKSLNAPETNRIIDVTLQNCDEQITKEEVKVIVLCPEIFGGSIGITLAGGTDYETKAITVHKVRSGSPAARDAKLQKGDRILSINGKSMKGLTHAESIAVLKEPVSEVIIVACVGKENPPTPVISSTSRHNSMIDLTPILSPKGPDIAASPSVKNTRQEVIVVTLIKDGPSLGFSMEGGKDSLQGDVPLVIKKLFTGAAADKSGQLRPGDELMEINGMDVTNMSKLDVWSRMKKLADGEVILKVRR